MSETDLKKDGTGQARRSFVITGLVQGVGFRPAVFRMAEQWGVTGFVRNTAYGVELEIQGTLDKIERFTAQFTHRLTELAPLARIEVIRVSDIPICSSEHCFSIIQSEAGPERDALISPDIATCHACLREILDPSDRRYHYPFANCTNCGPRYTIIRDIPYDRAFTTMACFPMCPECSKEFVDPLNRRFHAQPNACPVCGPHIWLTGDSGEVLARGDAGIDILVSKLLAGNIAAIKGLGGFHLACDAYSEHAVALLRTRKSRPAKPFAVMVSDSRAAEQVALLSEKERELLESPAAPIVLCRKVQNTPLCTLVAPDTESIGLMLPSTPVHHLLFDRLARLAPDRFPALIMTSGNKNGAPIAIGNREALRDLAGLADVFLLHDRDILNRIDDSVVRSIPNGNGTEWFRRARGYVPRPIALCPEVAFESSVMAVGAELKSTICLTRKNFAFVSQHIGDLDSLAAHDFFREVVDQFPKIFAVNPDMIVRDLHPDYHSSVWASEIAAQQGIPLLCMQHHAAHIYSVLAEHHRLERTLGLALDGTGLGHDRTIWGGELLLVEPEHPQPDCIRIGHIAPMPLPGGDAAAREPWRMTLALLHSIDASADAVVRSWKQNAPAEEATSLLWAMLKNNIRCLRATSCGRLFDAVYGLLAGEAGALVQEYEGQAPIRLESLMQQSDAGSAPACEIKVYACPLRYVGGHYILDTIALFRQVVEDWKHGVPPGVISLRFHAGLVDGLACLVKAGAQHTGIKTVALSGGVLQNSYIRLQLPQKLFDFGLQPLLPLEVPANDGGISLGQAFWGLQVLASRG